jgi:hypothetical protein
VSTVTPIMKAKSPEKIPRYKYSLAKKEIAPSVILVPMLLSCSRISDAPLASVSYSDLYSLLSTF